MASHSHSAADDVQSRISPTCPSSTSEILSHAWHHDVAGLKKLLDVPGKASCQDPVTGETPLHAAIRSCGPFSPASSSTPATTTVIASSGATGGHEVNVEDAKAAVHELFLSGAIWNDVDDHNETPGCVAWRLGRTELYNLCVEAGVRAELLFGLLDGYEELSSGSEEDDEGMEEEETQENGHEAEAETEVEENGETNGAEATEPTFQAPKTDAEQEVKSEKYLRSKLTYSDGKLVDDDGNGVMMAWETEIMRQSVDALLPNKEEGKRILNIGFGMGIIDSMFAETKPARHHIIEAHEEVLEHVSNPESTFGSTWEESAPEPGAYKIHQGRWQDIVPQLLERGEIYDAIYFDTFGEDYGQLKMFFTEYVPGLLDQYGIFGFFNGLGADRRICYDVYTKVVEMHLTDAGLDVDWKDIDVDLKGLEEAGKGEWEGVKRRYWTLNSKLSLLGTLYARPNLIFS